MQIVELLIIMIIFGKTYGCQSGEVLIDKIIKIQGRLFLTSLQNRKNFFYIPGSFDEVTMTIFVATPGTTTLPVAMYSYISQSIDPLVALRAE